MASEIKPAVLSHEECHRLLCQPGGPFEIVETTLHGRKGLRVFKHAPKDIRVLWDMVLAVNPSWEWFVYENERITYGEGVKRVQQVSHILQKVYGIKKGDHVGIASRNFPEFMIAFWAIVAMGCVAVPINAWLTGPELLYCATDSDCKLIFADAERIERLEPHYSDLFDPAKSQLRSLVVIKPSGRALKPAPHGGSVITWDGFMARGDPKWRDIEVPRVELAPESGLMILFTSGTTGLPKGAYICQQGWLQGVPGTQVVMARYFLRRGDAIPEPPAVAVQRVSLQVAPLFHGTGLWPVITGSTTGTKYVMIYKWEPGLGLKLIEQEKVNGITAVPTIVWQMMEHPDVKTRDISSFDTMMYSGAPAAPEIVGKLKALIKTPAPGFAFGGVNAYGMTELSQGVVFNMQEDYLRKPHSVGVAGPLFDVKIVDEETGKEVPRGQRGEIWIRGPGVIQGYYKKPEANAKTFTPDGFIKTGDSGLIDDEGFLVMQDRIKDMLIRGGENIYSAEVEAALMTCDSVVECAVVGIPHRVLGEEVGCVARVKPEALAQGEAKLAQQITEQLKTKLGAFKIPVHWDFRTEELVKNGSMKILKRELRKELQEKVLGSAQAKL
ncbi:AMP-dependent synthetase and ligase [Hyaloraphidium curvatum]|nr:AMP-dependent synthetase and ligase [Hyaloraphidium curvatum]